MARESNLNIYSRRRKRSKVYPIRSKRANISQKGLHGKFVTATEEIRGNGSWDDS